MSLILVLMVGMAVVDMDRIFHENFGGRVWPLRDIDDYDYDL
jgi:hypothetical protein